MLQLSLGISKLAPPRSPTRIENRTRGRSETNRLLLHHVLILGEESAAQRARRSDVVVKSVSS